MNVRGAAIVMLACMVLGGATGALAGYEAAKPGPVGPTGPQGVQGAPGPRGAVGVAPAVQAQTTGVCVAVDSTYDASTAHSIVTDVKVWTPIAGCRGGTFVATAP
jgi:hypothetical protein